MYPDWGLREPRNMWGKKSVWRGNAWGDGREGFWLERIEEETGGTY